ncbi:MAG TPA: hypothetical protein VFS20_26670 [Longimicrobium sp.]|nr:hypothetical protein [Longimicrobium sp.]
MTFAHAFAHDPAVISAADLIITRCLSLKPGQTFLLIYDETTTRFPGIFEPSASACGVEYVGFFVPQALQETPAGAFTQPLVGAIQRAQGILVATSGAERCSSFRITLTTDKRGAGCQVATMPGATLEILRTAFNVDYDEIFEASLGLTLPLLKGEACRITTFGRDGTEHVLQLSLGGMQRAPIQGLGIIPSDAWGNIPAGEIFIAPIEDSAEGEFLVNGAVGTERLTGGREALLEFSRGRLVRDRYVGTARRVGALTEIQQIAEGRGHFRCWNVIAELGIGLNRIIPRITGIPLIDEKKYGTVHIAIGHNMGYGGRNDCRSVHCDITTAGPTVEIDGHTIIREGEHVVNAGEFMDSYRSFAPSETTAGHSTVVIKPRSFEVRGGRLLVRRFTGAGRETLYPIGDEETSRLAHRLLETAEEDVLDVTAAGRRLRVSDETVHALLALLSFHGMISP